MSRTSWILGGLLVVALVAVGWLWREQRGLRAELAALRRPAEGSEPWSVGKEGGPAATESSSAEPVAGKLSPIRASAERPVLPDQAAETRQQRRARRQADIAGMLGRLEGETDDEYRQRMLPLMTMALGPLRESLEGQRRDAEATAKVTAEQRKQLDAAFADVYDDLISYTNDAIAGGDLTPYHRNIAGVLQHVGGLGAILESTNQRIGQVLSTEQMQTIYGTGFEWAEYLGMGAPWERLTPPPPPPPGG